MGLESLFTGISGLEANSTWLDVISNNISNSNTIAYKASRVEFSDAMSNLMQGGQSPAGNFGGVNPEQVGLGTRVSSIFTLFTQGPTIQTGQATDVAIQGNGFLVVKKGDSQLFTRAGNLTFDAQGNLVDQNGGLIQGYNASVQYSTREINTTGNYPGALPLGTTLRVTDATIGLKNTTSTSNPIQDIQITAGMTIPAHATQNMVFSGNLDSFQQTVPTGGQTASDFTGGLQYLTDSSALPTIPLGFGLENWGTAALFDGGKANTFQNGLAFAVPIASGTVATNASVSMHEIANLAAANAAGGTIDPVIVDGVLLTQVQTAFAGGQTNFAWDQNPPVTPARTSIQTVYDSLGNPREVTTVFYQVNDLGSASPAVNTPPGPSQVAYAWYSFETTGGKAISTTNLLGGTGITEGEYTAATGAQVGYDRGTQIIPPVADTYAQYWGDLVYFNTDGSLASTGGVVGKQLLPPGGPTGQAAGLNGGPIKSAVPMIYLPPLNPGTAIGGPAPPISPIPTIGAEITAISMDFGTAGPLSGMGGTGITVGQRDGLTSDATGSYQLVNGVNTYIPNSSAYVKSQDGFAEGTLQSVAFDNSGIVHGSFSNGQTVALAQVVMAQIDNPDGMVKQGDGYYAASSNSGNTFIGLAGQRALGTVQGGALEGSNVDLTVELSNMIIAQRGYDVNARVISVTNATLQTLTDLGRGG